MLEGVKVLDLSRMLPGPLCSWYLHGMGASVDRIESPKTGDMTRSVPPFENGIGVFFCSLNRGNRSCALNLRNEDGVAALCAMIPHYDVLIEGFRPGVMEAIGVGPDRIRALNPRMVVARISGFGQTGPWVQRPGHDINYVGLAGIPNWSTDRAVPPVQIADTTGGLVAAMGIASALYAREKTGEGSVLDVSLAEAALGVVGPHLAMMTGESREAIPGGEFLSGGLPTYGTYECKDGKWLTVGALEPKFQAALLAELGTVQQKELKERFRSKGRDEWVALLENACVGPCLGASEVAEHPQHAARGAAKRVGEATFVRPPFAKEAWHKGSVPGLGAHTTEVLTEAGVSSDLIRRWKTAGAVFGE